MVQFAALNQFLHFLSESQQRKYQRAFASLDTFFAQPHPEFSSLQQAKIELGQDMLEVEGALKTATLQIAKDQTYSSLFNSMTVYALGKSIKEINRIFPGAAPSFSSVGGFVESALTKMLRWGLFSQANKSTPSTTSHSPNLK